MQQSDFRTRDDGTLPPGTTPAIFNAVFGYFINGGQRCYVVGLDQNNTLTGGAAGRAGLDLLEVVYDVAMVAAPGLTDPGSYDALLTHARR